MSISKTGSNVGKAYPAATSENFFPQFIFTPGFAPGQVNAQLVPMSGIPMRDYFAAHALATCAGSWDGNDPDTSQGVARWCYRIADAMLAARETKPAGPETSFNDSQYHGDHVK